MSKPSAIRVTFALAFVFGTLLFIGNLNTGVPTPANAAVATGVTTVGDWPMYGHDAQHTSYNPDETILNTTNVAQLAQYWQANIGLNPSGNPAFSGPVVANGKVYVASSTTTGNNLFAFDTSNASQVWSTFIGSNPAECFGVNIGSTASISGTLLSIGGGDSAYYGINALTGAQIWRSPMNEGASAMAWTSPLQVNGKVYVGVASDCDNPSVPGSLRALDPVTGAITQQLSFTPNGQFGAGMWNSAALSPDGTKMVVDTGEDNDGYNGAYTRAMISLDPNTFQVFGWHQVGTSNEDLDWGSSPIIFHDSQGRTLVGANHKNGHFYTYDLANIAAGPIWGRAGGGASGLLAAYDPTFGSGGTLFFSVGGNELFAVDPANNQTRWPALNIGSTEGNMAVANGLIFINSNGNLMIVNEHTGSIIRTITPANHGIGLSGPSISNGTVYWVSGSYLNAWKLASLITPIPTATNTATPTQTSSPTMTFTPTATSTPCTVCPTPTCSVQFSDVPTDSTFYSYIHCLSCMGIVSGYPDGTFHPQDNVTRGQTAKIVSNSADFHGVPGPQLFQDVPADSTFFIFVQQLANRGYISGYPCGGDGEPCVAPDNLPYFRPDATTSRGQIAKIVANSAGLTDAPGTQLFQDVPPSSPFFDYVQRLAHLGVMTGYACGSGPDDPCIPPGLLPYFRPSNIATRGQTSKIVSITFFPDCSALSSTRK